MTAIGAILKAITRASEGAAAAAERGLRAAILGLRPRLRPILIPVETRRRPR